MPMLVHIAPDGAARAIRRNGIAPRRLGGFVSGCDRFVWAFPVLPSYTLTNQWMRELKRWGPRTLVAVHFRVPDDEAVFARHYRERPMPMSAAEAVGTILRLDDPRGIEILLPRRILPGEVHAIRALPRGIGWRYMPEAKGRPLAACDCPFCMPRGEVGARRYRERVKANMRRLYGPPG